MESGVISLRLDPFAQGILEVLSSQGWARLIDVQCREEVLALCQEFGTPWGHRHADEQGVTTLSNLGWQAADDRGFSAEALSLHTDASSEALPPEILFFWCEVPSTGGGSVVLSDGLAIYRLLADEDSATIDALEDSHCQTLLGGDKMQIAPLFDCARKGWRFLRHRRDELVVVAPEAYAAVGRFIEVSDRISIEFSLNRGEGYILNNGRILHGRSAYTGTRQSHRVLVYLKDALRKGPVEIDRGFPI